jgi:hypothetical protein
LVPRVSWFDDKASEQLRAGLRLAQQLADAPIAELCLESLAAIAAVQRRPHRVALLLGLADRMCARGALAAPGASPASELRRPLPDGLKLANLTTYAKAELGASVFDATRKSGSRLFLEDLLADVLPAN